VITQTHMHGSLKDKKGWSLLDAAVSAIESYKEIKPLKLVVNSRQAKLF